MAIRLSNVREEKQRADNLHDELRSVLAAKAKQQKTFKEYQSQIKEMKSQKLDMKREYRTGRRGPGGGKWPLWTVEMCCDLLVNGTPPSAVPSNICTLYETFYGTEAKECPSVNFVRQCRVLIKIIGETISAMKLAACPDWEQIFFDATTRRQIPFSAVIISLMGDDATALDPVIVSSCVITDDETAEVTADAIVKKVSVHFG